jgi:hypothetical protein
MSFFNDLYLPYNGMTLILGYSVYRGYYTSYNVPDGIENATHNTFAK